MAYSVLSRCRGQWKPTELCTLRFIAHPDVCTRLSFIFYLLFLSLFGLFSPFLPYSYRLMDIRVSYSLILYLLRFYLCFISNLILITLLNDLFTDECLFTCIYIVFLYLNAPQSLSPLNLRSKLFSNFFFFLLIKVYLDIIY